MRKFFMIIFSVMILITTNPFEVYANDSKGINVRDYNVSGSSENTTGSISANSNILTVATAMDFKVNQGVRLNGIPGVITLVITAGATDSGNVILTTAGENYRQSVDVISGDAATTVAEKIRSSYFEGWATSGSGSTVIFTASGPFPTTRTTSFDPTTTGCTGTISVTTPAITNFISKITAINGTTFTLADKAPVSFSGVGVYHDDTAGIQAAITGSVGQTLYVPGGNYYTSTHLKVPSNCTISLDSNATVILAPGSQCDILQNTDFQNGNSNITIKGGRWLGNGRTFARSWGTDNCVGFAFRKVTNLTVQDLYMEEIRTWAIEHFNTVEGIFRNIELSQIETENGFTLIGRNGDGITGTGNHILIENISGFTNDDMVALGAGTTNIGTGVMSKDSSDIVIRNIRPMTKKSVYTHRAVALYAIKGCTLSNVLVDGVEGDTNYNPVYLANYDYRNGAGLMSNVQITNIRSKPVLSYIPKGIVNMSNLTIDILKLSNLSSVKPDQNMKQIINNVCKISNMDIS